MNEFDTTSIPRAVDSTVPRLLIVGNDLLLEVRPATAVQLAHAVQAAGFDLAVPQSWGDELIAEECVRSLAAFPGRAVVLCSCPLVRDALERSELPAPIPSISVLPPSVAAARYCRALYAGRAVHITYAGDCPATDDAIDERISSADFLSVLAARGIDVLAQPRVFDSVIPPDRRRHVSTAGGVPRAARLSADERSRVVREIGLDALRTLGDDAEGRDVLLDLASAVGCACARDRVAVSADEPPPSHAPVVQAELIEVRDLPPRFRVAPPRMAPTSRDAPVLPNDAGAPSTGGGEEPEDTSEARSIGGVVPHRARRRLSPAKPMRAVKPRLKPMPDVVEPESTIEVDAPEGEHVSVIDTPARGSAIPSEGRRTDIQVDSTAPTVARTPETASSQDTPAAGAAVRRPFAAGISSGATASAREGTPRSPGSRRRTLLAIALLLVAAIGGTAAALYWRSQRSDRTVTSTGNVETPARTPPAGNTPRAAAPVVAPEQTMDSSGAATSDSARARGDSLPGDSAARRRAAPIFDSARSPTFDSAASIDSTARTLRPMRRRRVPNRMPGDSIARVQPDELVPGWMPQNAQAPVRRIRRARQRVDSNSAPRAVPGDSMSSQTDASGRSVPAPPLRVAPRPRPDSSRIP